MRTHGFAVLLAGLAACGDSTPPRVATTIAAQAGIPATAAAGSTVTASVLVADQDARPLAGVPVTFAVTGGGGSIAGPATVHTNASGIARSGAWTLGTTITTNTLAATSGALPSVGFSVGTVAGAAATVAKVSGDNQTVSAGAAVTTRPTVRVTDGFGNPIAGVAVTFAVTTGSGTLTGPTALTMATGQAAVGSWILGPTPGANAMSATVAGLAPVSFGATGSVPCNAATNGVPFTIGAAATSHVLATTDCRLTTTLYADFHTFTTSEFAAYRFTQQSTAMNPYLILFTAGQAVVGENNNTSATDFNSTLNALLPPGSWFLAATSGEAGQTGAYQVAGAVRPASVTNCEPMFTVLGVTTAQTLSATDCLVTDGAGGEYYTDVFLVSLAAGTIITVDMTSSEVDSYLELVDLAGAGVLNNDRAAGTRDAQVTYTVPANAAGYHLVLPSSWASLERGAYVLTITAVAPSGARMSVAPQRVRVDRAAVERLRGAPRRR